MPATVSCRCDRASRRGLFSTGRRVDGKGCRQQGSAEGEINAVQRSQTPPKQPRGGRDKVKDWMRYMKQYQIKKSYKKIRKRDRSRVGMRCDDRIIRSASENLLNVVSLSPYDG